MKRLLLGLVALAAVVVYVPSPHGNVANATNPVQLKHLLSCADVNSPNPDGAVSAPDFFAVLGRFGAQYPAANFSYIYDLGGTSPNGSVDATDFFKVLGQFGMPCPLVDTQISRATLAILNHPQAANIMACDEATLESLGYYRGSSDVPGQGVHYVNFSPTIWDGNFNVLQAEGLVCDGGRLAAELYVVMGDVIGWGSWNGSAAVHSVNIDSATNCTPSPCSWATAEGWHAHARLCTINVGEPDALAFPTDQASCIAAAGGDPICTMPISTTPCYTWDDRVGWMGHLWNFQLNGNLVDENGDTIADHGRFADCAPPTKAESCPM